MQIVNVVVMRPGLVNRFIGEAIIRDDGSFEGRMDPHPIVLELLKEIQDGRVEIAMVVER